MEGDIQIFNKTFILVLMITSSSALAMDPIKEKAEKAKPAPSLFARLFCCISQDSSEHVVTIKAKPMRPIDRTLIEAATAGNAAAVQAALKNGAQVNAQDENGDTPLHKAIVFSYLSDPYRMIFNNCPEGVDVLMNAGADVTVKNNAKYTPLYSSLFFCGPELEEVLLAIAPRVINGIHANYKKHMYDGNKDDSEPSPLHKLLGGTLYDILYLENPNSVDASKPLVDAILCTGFDMTVKVDRYTANVYQMGSGQAAADFIGTDVLRGHVDRDAIREKRKKMLAGTESAIFEFQKKHRSEIERVIGGSIHPDLLPLIYECLYIRPYEDGRITNYLKELLTIRLSPEFTAADVAARVESVKRIGGVVLSKNVDQN